MTIRKLTFQLVAIIRGKLLPQDCFPGSGFFCYQEFAQLERPESCCDKQIGPFTIHRWIVPQSQQSRAGGLKTEYLMKAHAEVKRHLKRES